MLRSLARCCTAAILSTILWVSTGTPTSALPSARGSSAQGFGAQGSSAQGFGAQGFGAQGFGAEGSRLDGFSIRPDGTAAGRWLGSYRVGDASAYRIDPKADGKTGPWTSPKQTSQLTGVSARALRRAAWIVSRYGAPLSDPSASDAQAAAVDAAVYAVLRPEQLGLGTNWAKRRLGQSTHGSSVQTLAEVLLAQSALEAGPYVIKVAASPTAALGSNLPVQVKVISKTGQPVSAMAVEVELLGQSVAGLTNKNGVFPAVVRAAELGPTKLKVSLPRAPDWRLHLMRPEAADQSRAILAGQRVELTKTHPIRVRAIPKIDGLEGATAPIKSRFALTFNVSGGSPSSRAGMARLYGPWPSRVVAESRGCTGRPVKSIPLTVAGNATYNTASMTLSTAGHYRWRVELEPNELNEAALSDCGGETWIGHQPTIKLEMDRPDAFDEPISTTSQVAGLAQPYQGSLTTRLYGPFNTAEVACSGASADATNLQLSADGTHHAPALRASEGGWYGVRSSVSAAELSFPAESLCLALPAPAKPRVSDLKTSGAVHVGQDMTATWKLSDGTNSARSAQIKLFGPYPTAAAARAANCTAKQVMSAQVSVDANGTYRTPVVRATADGHYTWSVEIGANPVNLKVTKQCGGASIVKSKPRLTATAPRSQVAVNSRISAEVEVADLPLGFTGPIDVELYGPFAHRGNLACTASKRYGSRTVDVPGDGTYTSARLRVTKRGWFVWQAQLAATDLSDATQSRCNRAVSQVQVR